MQMPPIMIDTKGRASGVSFLLPVDQAAERINISSGIGKSKS